MPKTKLRQAVLAAQRTWQAAALAAVGVEMGLLDVVGPEGFTSQTLSRRAMGFAETRALARTRRETVKCFIFDDMLESS
jgi:hypothetical protein